MQSRKIIEASKADSLLASICNESQERWVKTKRDIGNYSCLFKHTMSKRLYEELSAIALNKNPFELGEIVVNRYNKGEYIENHIDSTAYFACEILQLTANENEGLIYKEEGEEHFIQDRKGFSNNLHPLDTEHEVKPVNNLRVVVIYLYK